MAFEKTKVPVEKTRLEIETLVKKYGADQFMSASDDSQNRVMVQFRLSKRIVKFQLQLTGRDEHKSNAAWEQSGRQRWRALLLCIKGKLEAVESGICEIDDEFMSYTIMPNGQTCGEWLKPQIEQSFLTGKMPESMLALPSPNRN